MGINKKIVDFYRIQSLIWFTSFFRVATSKVFLFSIPPIITSYDNNFYSFQYFHQLCS